ncbi:MAG: SUMF1/EgtB/PvdO family nonheme iron enzyme [Tannerellaceae bacterium]|jgi:formylglycine-generating enzyme required for sulfatase activity|nr:SUMF1/EgtB/PvdO family nonheme iron enzyme [Tannerellaceae bacterium]
MNEFTKMLLVIGVLFFSLFSCADERDKSVKETELRSDIRFSTFIENKVTRTVNNGEAWKRGDEIGIYMKLSADNLEDALYGNFRYVAFPDNSAPGQTLLKPGNRMDSAIFFPKSLAPIDFIAYYPYDPGVSTTGVVKVDIRNQNDRELLNLLYSRESLRTYDTTQMVVLPFKHKMAKMRLEINVAAGMNVNLEHVKVRLDGIPDTASLHIANGSLTATGSPGSIYPGAMRVPVGFEEDSASFQCIIIPHRGSDYDNRKVLIAAEGKTYAWYIPDATDFEENKVYTYHLTLSSRNVTGISGGILPWLTGEDREESVNEEPPTESGKPLLMPLPGGKYMDAVYIRKGSFVMGSPTSEPMRADSSESQHAVTLAKDFIIGKYEVTNEQFAFFLNDMNVPASGIGSDNRLWINSNATCGLTYSAGWKPVSGKPKYPVSSVSWCGAKAYAEWVGNGCRLPSESEWEYACRAGTQTTYFFGSDTTNIKDYVWYGYTSKSKQPSAVGLKKPNGWGLHDMCGNVFEFCSDRFAADYMTPQANVYSLRGGSYDSNSKQIRSAYRFFMKPEICEKEVGFRVAFDVPEI